MSSQLVEAEGEPGKIVAGVLPGRSLSGDALALCMLAVPP